MKKISSTLIAIFTVFMLTLIGCSSISKKLPDNISEDELIIRAQESYDDNDIHSAEFYYNEIINRFGDNPKSYIIAKFELAHLKIKQKKYNTAKPILLEILSLYEDSEKVELLPPEYKKLAEIDLAKITDKN